MRRAATSVAIVGSACVLASLAALHVLSPEFDPSWRVVSEYADGHYAWVLTLMFAAWAVSSLALAYALWPIVPGVAGRAGLWFLIAAGIGEALAAVFDVNQPLHGLAGILGTVGLPVAALLITPSLRRGKTLTWVTHLTWIVVVALIFSLVLLFVTFTHNGGHVPAGAGTLPIGTKLPAGSIALVGYVNRLMVLVNCAWVMLVACRLPIERSIRSADVVTIEAALNA